MEVASDSDARYEKCKPCHDAKKQCSLTPHYPKLGAKISTLADAVVARSASFVAGLDSPASECSRSLVPVPLLIRLQTCSD